MKTKERELIGIFGKHYRERIGELYSPNWGRDTKIFKTLLEFHTFELIEKCLEYYFLQKRNIYSMPYFKIAISEVIQEIIQGEMSIPPPIEDNESWRFND